MPTPQVDLFRLPEADLVKMAHDLGSRVQYVPMVAVPSIEDVARGTHPSMYSDVEWLPLIEGVEKLLSRSGMMRDFDPLEKHLTSQ